MCNLPFLWNEQEHFNTYWYFCGFLKNYSLKFLLFRKLITKYFPSMKILGNPLAHYFQGMTLDFFLMCRITDGFLSSASVANRSASDCHQYIRIVFFDLLNAEVLLGIHRKNIKSFQKNVWLLHSCQHLMLCCTKKIIVNFSFLNRLKLPIK